MSASADRACPLRTRSELPLSATTAGERMRARLVVGSTALAANEHFSGYRVVPRRAAGSSIEGVNERDARRFEIRNVSGDNCSVVGEGGRGDHQVCTVMPNISG